MTADEKVRDEAAVGRCVIAWHEAVDRLDAAEQKLKRYRDTTREWAALGEDWPPPVDRPWPSKADVSRLHDEIREAKAEIAGAKNDLRNLRIDPSKLQRPC